MAKPRRSLRTFLPVAVGMAVAIALLQIFGFMRPIRSAALAVTQPLTTRLYSAGASLRALFEQPADVESLQQQTEELRNENLRLRQQIADLQQAKQENVALRQLLDFFEQDVSDLPRVMARISSRDPLQPTVLVLNVGQRDGISMHNAVVANDGVLVAKIIEVGPRSSKALLLTDQASTVAVTLSDGTPSSKLVRGERGLSLLLDQVPQQETLRLGQFVITSGLEAAVPRGLLVGEVEEIVSERNDLFQTAILRPLANFDSLSLVAVILTPTT